MPWYITPAALAIINAIPARPEIVWEECALSGSKLPDFAIPEALADLHRTAFEAVFRAPVFDEAAAEEISSASPSMILHALFGSAGWLQEADFGALWPTIRMNIAGARMAEAA